MMTNEEITKLCYELGVAIKESNNINEVKNLIYQTIPTMMIVLSEFDQCRNHGIIMAKRIIELEEELIKLQIKVSTYEN